MSILIAPHSDDEALFASYIIQRFKPTVFIVTDGYQHQHKFGVPIETRILESKKACGILGVPVKYLHLSDDELVEDCIMQSLPNGASCVFAPLYEADGGNEHHNLISKCCTKKYGVLNLYYGTYTKDRLYPAGKLAIAPTRKEQKVKEQVLNCYASQIKINKIHFDSVKGKDEYLS